MHWCSRSSPMTVLPGCPDGVRSFPGHCYRYVAQRAGELHRAVDDAYGLLDDCGRLRFGIRADLAILLCVDRAREDVVFSYWAELLLGYLFLTESSC